MNKINKLQKWALNSSNMSTIVGGQKDAGRAVGGFLALLHGCTCGSSSGADHPYWEGAENTFTA